MSQAIFPNINPSVTSGNQLATLLNGFKDAVASGFSGVARPPNIQAGGYWIDTALAATPNFLWVMKVYTGSTDLTLFTLNISTNTVSVGGASGSFLISQTSANAIGPILALVKKRIAGSGQTLIGDSLGELTFSSTDNSGIQYISARIRTVSADNTLSTTTGAYISFEATNATSAALLEQMRLSDGKLGVGTVSPIYVGHFKGASGLGVEIESDTVTAVKITGRKKRVSVGGKVLNGDGILQLKGQSTDQLGSEVDAFILDVVAVEDHTSTAHGTRADIKVKKTGAVAFTTKMQIGNVLNFPDGDQTQSQIIGSSATAASNVKINRSAVGKAQIVLGSDVTAEASLATVLAQLGFVAENFVNASKPANNAANAGRIIYVSDTNKFEYDTGAAWAGIGGGAYVVSTVVATNASSLPFAGTTSRRVYKLTPTTPQDFTALSKQIADGIDEGQELTLYGTSDTNFCTFNSSGTNLIINGDWNSALNKTLNLIWLGTTWIEMGRN